MSQCIWIRQCMYVSKCLCMWMSQGVSILVNVSGGRGARLGEGGDVYGGVKRTFINQIYHLFCSLQY